MHKIKTPLARKYSYLIILLVTTVLLASFGPVAWFIISKNKTTFSQNFINDTVNLVDYFSRTIYDGLRLDDDILLSQTFDRVKNMRNIEYAVLFDQQKKIKFHSEIFSRQKFEKEQIPGFFFTAAETVIHPAFNPNIIEPAYGIARAFYDERGKFYGLLLVKYSTGTLQKLLADITRTLIAILALVLILGIALSVIFGFAIASFTVKPVSVIAAGTEIIGSGNLEHIINISTDDELGLLAANFNAMTLRIREAQKLMIEKEKQEEQLKVAQKIQTSIFPKNPLLLPDCEIASFSRAAKTIGGDYHYYRRINDNLSFFILADVSGKGIPAALVTFMIAIIINSVIAKQKEPEAAAIINEANLVLAPEMFKFRRYATVMLCLYNSAAQQINFCSAGHGNLIIYRAESGEFEQLENKNMVMGMEETFSYHSSHTNMKPGDSILVFSDGVTDARNSDGRSYSLESVFSSFKKYSALPVIETLGGIQKEIDIFAGKAEQFDDMTLLLFRRL